MDHKNHPFLVWGACLLWFISVFAITWSIIIFISLGDVLIMTGTDLIMAMVLLSGIIMLPTNMYIMSSISCGRKINHRSKVVCCPIWLCIGWIILINLIGMVFCAHKMYCCKETLSDQITKSLQYYRNIPKYKHFIDNVQWTLKCCGLNSYKDWFDYEWYDKIRDYDFDPREKPKSVDNRGVKPMTDSVPLSCCKSGSCIANYLLELGTGSISTVGCGVVTHRVLITALIAHFALFFCIILSEILVLVSIMEPSKNKPSKFKRMHNVRNIMSVKDNFNESSASQQLNPDESEDDSSDQRRTEHFKSILGDPEYNIYGETIRLNASKKSDPWHDKKCNDKQ